jgi:hypothetical protein
LAITFLGSFVVIGGEKGKINDSKPSVAKNYFSLFIKERPDRSRIVLFQRFYLTIEKFVIRDMILLGAVKITSQSCGVLFKISEVILSAYGHHERCQLRGRDLYAKLPFDFDSTSFPHPLS